MNDPIVQEVPVDTQSDSGGRSGTEHEVVGEELSLQPGQADSKAVLVGCGGIGTVSSSCCS